MELRSASNQDRPAVEHLVFSVLREFGLSPDAHTDADLRDIEAAYIRPGGLFDVLVAPSGQIVGTIGLCPVSKSTCELRKMYLDKSIRGQGHGRRLLEHALTRAKKLGFTRITLETANVLQTAIALYESNGFKEYTPTHKSCRCDRAYYLDLA
ncbi:MAG TPA: GNAT family N-acetyltransferase [Verrucomicrobiae bacterium]|nr:GNAT family N-acetyltransferase [Verrucomicrobiae bacterium]